MSHNIPYNPEVLKWAREYINYPIEEVARKFKKDIEEIKRWEKGESSPTYKQLERLAYEIYKKPLAIFFFPNPPNNDYIQKSFRTIAEYEFIHIEPKFKLLIDKAYSYQLNIKELTNNVNPSSNPILDNLKFETNLSTIEMTEMLRLYLNIPIEEQQRWRGVESSLKNWIRCLEDVGIFIFKEAFKNNNYSGFCLYDNNIPIIFLNNSKSKSRQIFTLFHELAHLLFNTSGIDSKNYFDYNRGQEELIETHCNAFAGEFLIPSNDFNEKIQELKITDKNIENLGKLYGVSKEAILRKYLNFKLISSDFYEEKREIWNKEYLERKKKQKGGPKPHEKANAYLSNKYKDIVLLQFNQKKVSFEEMGNYFNLPINHLNSLIELYMRKGY